MTHLVMIALLWAITLAVSPMHSIPRGRKSVRRARVLRRVPVDRYGAPIVRMDSGHHNDNPRAAGSNTGTPVEELSLTPLTSGRNPRRGDYIPGQLPQREDFSSPYGWARALRAALPYGDPRVKAAFQAADAWGKRAARERARLNDRPSSRAVVTREARLRRKARRAARRTIPQQGRGVRVDSTPATTTHQPVGFSRFSSKGYHAPTGRKRRTHRDAGPAFTRRYLRWVNEKYGLGIRTEAVNFLRHGRGRYSFWSAVRVVTCMVAASPELQEEFRESSSREFWRQKTAGILSMELTLGGFRPVFGSVGKKLPAGFLKQADPYGEAVSAGNALLSAIKEAGA